MRRAIPPTCRTAFVAGCLATLAGSVLWVAPVGMLIGVLMLGFIQNGLLLLGYAYYVQWLVTWVVIILPVWLDVAAALQLQPAVLLGKGSAGNGAY